MKTRIYHNPRCSKSRATLALLEARGLDFDVVEYLSSPPNARALRALLAKLEVRPHDLVRTGEDEFKNAGVDLATASDEQVLKLLEEHPKLLQRPIVETEAAARVGRPPERVLELFE